MIQARWGWALLGAAVLVPTVAWRMVSTGDDGASAASSSTTTTRSARPATTTTTRPAATTTTTTRPATTTTTASPPAGCPTFPADNVWHAPVDRLPVDARSAAFVAGGGAGAALKADFGSGTWDGGPIGIPVTTVGAGQPRVPVSFDYADESDPGPYPIPRNAAVEGGAAADGDRHVLVVDRGACRLYELWDAHPNADGSWHAGSGATYDLRADALRPAGWTSADAAGLPVLPGLVRYDEVASGHIDHAIRVTVPRTQNRYIWPARHAASDDGDPNLPPMGLRLRLRANADLSSLGPQAKVIARAMQRYGLIVADNGSAWYLSGAPDDHWNNDDLHTLAHLTGTALEAVDTSSMMASPTSARAR